MRLTIESTQAVTGIAGMTVRIWSGRTASGVRCTVLVHQIAAAEGEDQDQFQRDLRELEPPRFFTPLSLVVTEPEGP